MHKVQSARFHQGLHVKGVGELGNSLPSSTRSFPDLTMTIADLGLTVKFTFEGKLWTLLVPAANVSLMILVPEAPVVKAVKSA